MLGRIVAGIVGGVAVVVLLLIAAAVILLHSARFHNYLRSVAERQVSAALGAQVGIENFAVHLSNLSLDVYGLTIHGAAPHPDPPLLLVQHVEVGIRVVSIWHRKWYLDRIRVDRPVARIFTGAGGVTNLPTFKSSGGGHTTVFDLGIRHALLDHGELFYNDRESDLNAALQDVDFHAVFNVAQQKYSGELRYRNGVLRAAGFNPVAHDLDAEFTARPTELAVTRATISSGASRLLLAATLKNYSTPQIQGRYEAMLAGGDLRRILRNSSIPAGMVRTSGTVKVDYDPAVSVVDSAAVEGKLDSGELNLWTPDIRARLRDVAAEYSLAGGNLAVKNFRARLLGGAVTGTLEMRNLTGAMRSQAKATLRGISLAELERMTPRSAAMRNVRLGGVLNGAADAGWGKTPDDLVVRADATIRANVSRAGGVAAGVIPVNGVVHGTYRAAAQQIALAQSVLRMPQTTLTLNGAVGMSRRGGRSGLAVQLKSNDLAELETIADLVQTAKPGEVAQPLGLAGTATFDGVVRGSTSAPDLTGQLSAENVQVKGTTWKMLRTEVELSPSLIRLQHAELEPAPHGHIALSASARLSKWSFTQESPIEVQLHASQMDVANLEKLTGKTIPASGTLAASIDAHGTVLNPVGQGSATLTRAMIDGEPVPLAKLSFTGAEDAIHGRLAVHVAAGTVDGVVTVEPRQKMYAAQITATGIQIGKLQALEAHNVSAKGALSLHGSGQGTWDNPQFDATVEIPQLEVQPQTKQEMAGREMTGNDMTLSAIRLQMNVANHVATANLHSQAVGTTIQASAKVNLTGEYVADAKLDTQAIALGPVLAIYAPQAAGLNGETEVHATLQGPLKNKKLIEAHVTVPILKLNYGSAIQLAAAEPIHVDYKNGVLDLERAAIRGTDTNLEIQGSIPTVGHAPVSLLLLGTVNLQLAQMFNPDVRSSGEVKFNINTYGAQAGANVEGQVQIVNANFSSDALPIGMQHGNGVLTLTKDRLNVQSFKATVGGGTVTAQGGVAYRPAIQFDLGAAANGVRMLYPEGVREEIDADLRLTGTDTNAVLGGRVRVQNLSFTPNFDLVSFVGQLSGGIAPPPSQGFSQNLQLNVAVSSTNNINLVSRTLSIDGTANLQVRGTAADPVILGRINLNDGDLIFNGNRFTLGGGTVEFVNPAETQPVVNLALNTTIQQYNIALRFNGPVDQLRTNYTSDPSLPTADIINLLAFGQTTEASNANPTPADQAAVSLVASQVSSQITSRVSKIAGISQLSINPVLAGGSTQGPAGAVVTIQQRVTGNLFVTYSTNVASTENQIIMGQYKLSPKVAVSVTRDENGGIAFDTLFKRSW